MAAVGERTFDAFFAPIAPHYERKDVTEVVVNAIGEIGIETPNGWEWIETPELDYRALRTLCDLIAGFTKQDVSEEMPVVSSVLPDGARVQCVIPPAVPTGTVSITIRKASSIAMSMEDLEQGGLFERTAPREASPTDDELLALYRDKDWPRFLKRAVEERKNILISGATGSGKTSLSKALIKLIPDYERILTIEDTRELVVPQRNCVHMTYSKDGNSRLKIGAKELLESSLRMRPDRILLQELRDGTAFFYLRNVNSGHPGSITTVHANSAEGALEQLTLLVKESEGGNDLARDDIRALLRSLVDIVIQMKRFPPLDGESAKYRMTEVWFRPAESEDGRSVGAL
ncbi:MAG: P-type DNA transfer ATPase VirB11 [Novosphingobium sp.]